MTTYRTAELLHVITRCRARIMLATYRTAEQRERANLAADALGDLADALDREPVAPIPGQLDLDLCSRDA